MYDASYYRRDRTYQFLCPLPVWISQYEFSQPFSSIKLFITQFSSQIYSPEFRCNQRMPLYQRSGMANYAIFACSMVMCFIFLTDLKCTVQYSAQPPFPK